MNTVLEAIEAIRDGAMVIVVDDDDRENEGDLVMAAGLADPASIAFMVRHTSGILCTPLTGERARALQLQPMVSANDAPLQTAFTVSVDYRYGLTTGISADERTSTIRALANGNASAGDFVRPGHIFPLIAREGGVLVRSGHTEAAVDLCALAGLAPVGLIAELVNDDGTVKRLPQLLEFARAHGLKIVSIADLIDYRQRREQLVRRVGDRLIDSAVGPARALVYATDFDPVQHIALVFGDLGDGTAVPARIQREQPLAELTGSLNPTKERMMERLAAEGRGVFILLRDAVAAAVPYAGGREGADEQHGSARRRDELWREVGLGAQILHDLGIRSIRLLATHRRTYVGLAGFGIDIVETIIVDEEASP